MSTNSFGELQWQYQLNENWRTLSDKHSRIINDQCTANASSSVPVCEVELVVRGKPHIAKWLPESTSSLAPEEFARLVSFELSTEQAAILDFGELSALSSGPQDQGPGMAAGSDSSAIEQLRRRQMAQKETLVDDHARLLAAERITQAGLRAKMEMVLENEDAETKAMRAAMHSHNRDAAKAAADAHDDEAGDKRSRRIKFSTLYAAGVRAYRHRHPIDAATAALRTPSTLPPQSGSGSGGARVLVRARPLFSHEAERGEWESLSIMAGGGGVTVHESMEAMKSGRIVHSLRHHTFANVSTVSTDAELYDSVRYLAKHAANGGLATLFCYGMTGSGKTYSMDEIHRRVPADIFSLLASEGSKEGSKEEGKEGSKEGSKEEGKEGSKEEGKDNGEALVRFSSFELVAKRCFELLPADDATSEEAGEAKGEEGSESKVGTKSSDGKKEIFLRVDAAGVTNVRGVAEHTARDEQGLLQLLRAAVARRETSATGANATSSRSHAVYLVQLPGGGRLALIDLAGNEGRQETLYHTKAHIAEAKDISNSLAVLRACLRARSVPGAGHVPFRESVLTRVLKDALTDPDAATALLACVSPACTHLEHSLRTLRTALHLTDTAASSTPGDEATLAVVEEEELRLPTVVKKGPGTWDHDTLCGWVEEQQFPAEVVLPAAMTGKAIMKLTKPRLRPLCAGKDEVAAALFSALRVASKEADKYAREQRVQMKATGNKGGAAGFARGAPAKPQIAGT
jgi:kinesin family protein 2/24